MWHISSLEVRLVVLIVIVSSSSCSGDGSKIRILKKDLIITLTSWNW